MVMPQHKNHCPGCHEIDIFGSPVLDIITIYLILSEPYPRVKMMIFFKTQTVNPKIKSPWGGGHEVYYFLSTYPTDITYQICKKKKFLRRINARRTTTNANGNRSL